MKKILIKGLVFFLLMCPRGFANDIKQPNVSGQFYDAEPAKLTLRIKSYLDQAAVEPSDRNIPLLISPHAGYVYSGPVAAYAYKAISKQKYKTVVILAPSHFYGFDGTAVWPSGGFATPLGTVEVDSDFAGRLISPADRIAAQPQAFLQEHSLEVQIPFLQSVLPDFKIVPVIIGQIDFTAVEGLAKRINAIIGQREDVLVVASSDMSHYHRGDAAKEMDTATLKIIAKMDIMDFWSQCERRQKEMCGFVPVTALMLLAKERGLVPQVLRYATSGEVTGDNDRVVGYGAVIFSKETGGQESEAAQNNSGAQTDKGIAPLTKEQKKQLIDIARTTVEQYVRSKKVYEPQVTDARLKAEDGAFVTLRKHGELRGCIGNIIGRGPLYLTVRDMAIAAASEDPRFSPVAAAELKDVDLEISVLSVPRLTTNPEEITMGVHGVIVRRGFRSGVFLPQVADETGWGREEFLSNLCSHKAGLPPDAWKDPQTRLEIFTADVFSEMDFNK